MFDAECALDGVRICLEEQRKTLLRLAREKEYDDADAARRCVPRSFRPVASLAVPVEPARPRAVPGEGLPYPTSPDVARFPSSTPATPAEPGRLGPFAFQPVPDRAISFPSIPAPAPPRRGQLRRGLWLRRLLWRYRYVGSYWCHPPRQRQIWCLWWPVWRNVR